MYGKRYVGGLFAALVAAGLSFGASSALAMPSAASDCPYQPPDVLGACTSTGVAGCTRKCQVAGATMGDCISGCCVCIS